MVVRGSACRAAIWTSRRSTPASSMVESVSQHVGMRPSDRHADLLREPPQAAGSSVPVHPGTAAVEQDRAPHPAFDGAVHGPADRRRQRDQDDLAALAAHAKDTVTMLFTQVVDAGAGGLEDPQA